MFADPFTSVMALILLAFVGTLVIFFCLWREMDALRRTLQDVRSSMQMYAMDMEQQTRELAAVSRDLRALALAGKPTVPPAEPDGFGDLGRLLEQGLPYAAEAFPPAAGARTDAATPSVSPSAAMHPNGTQQGQTQSGHTHASHSRPVPPDLSDALTGGRSGASSGESS